MTFPCFHLQLLLWGAYISGRGSHETWLIEHRGRPHPAAKRRAWDATPAERAVRAKQAFGPVPGALSPTWGLPYVELACERRTIDTKRKVG